MNKKLIDTIDENTLIILDTSAILDIYRYSITSSKRILVFLKQYSEIMWIPAQVKDEVIRNSDTVKSEHINKYKNLSKILIREVESLHNTLQSKLVNYKKYNFSGIDILESQFIDKFEDIKQTIQQYKTTLVEEEEIYKDFILNDAEKFIISILESEKVGEPFNIVELIEILKEGEIRYRYSIPPGYEDEQAKEGIKKFGDLILWKQILRKALKEEKNIIFIISDTKEDWFTKQNDGSIENVRMELINEFYYITKRNNLNITSMSNFIDQIIGDSDKDLLIELRKEKVMNRLSKDKYSQIVYEFIEAIDGDDLIHYLSNNLSEKIDDLSLMEIDNLNFAEISVQNKGDVYIYNVIINFVTRFDCNAYYETHSSNATIACETSCNINIIRNLNVSEDVFLESISKQTNKVVKIDSLIFKREEYIWSGDSDPIKKTRTYDRVYQQVPYTTCPLCGVGMDLLNDAGNGFCLACSRSKET